MHKNSYEFLRPVDSFSDTRIMKVTRETVAPWRLQNNQKERRICVMKKTKKMLSFVLSMLLIVTMFPTMAFAKEEAKTWKFGELSLKAGDVLGKDTEIKNDAENREIRILSEKTNPDEKKDQKDDKERIKTEKEAVIAAAASWNLKDLMEKAKKAPADYLLKKADSWNGSWIVTKIAETETKDAIEIQIRTYEYAAVTEIQGIPKEIPGTTALTGKAVPENADQKQITWEIHCALFQTRDVPV